MCDLYRPLESVIEICGNVAAGIKCWLDNKIYEANSTRPGMYCCPSRRGAGWRLATTYQEVRYKLFALFRSGAELHCRFVETKYKIEFGAAQTNQLNKAISHGADKGVFALPKGMVFLSSD